MNDCEFCGKPQYACNCNCEICNQDYLDRGEYIHNCFESKRCYTHCKNKNEHFNS